MKNFFKMRNILEEEGVIFVFNGVVNQAILTSIIKTLEKKFEHLDIEENIMYDLFTIFVEQMQNITHYVEENREITSEGTVFIGYNNTLNNYYILTGNVMQKDSVDKLKDKIDKVNSLDKKELRKYYKEMRRSGKDAHSKGAGLGILEIAKRVSEPLEYQFIEINEKEVFYILKSTI